MPAEASEGSGGPDAESVAEQKRVTSERVETAFKKVARDGRYRSVLATSSELGASISTTRLARLALVVAVASMVVAAVTLVVAQVDGVTIIELLSKWVAGRGR